MVPISFTVNFIIKSCEDMTDKSTCKPFLNQLATNEICLLLKTPLPSYKDFIRRTNPPLRCPIQKTTYKFRDYPLANEMSRYMQRSNKQIYYLSRISGSTSNGREVGCYEFFLHAAVLKKSSL